MNFSNAGSDIETESIVHISGLEIINKRELSTDVTSVSMLYLIL